MKKLFLVLAFLLTFQMFAQQNKLAIGGQVGISIPMGDLGEVVDPGFSFLGNFYVGIDQNIDIAGTIGYTCWEYEEENILKSVGVEYATTTINTNNKISFTDVPIIIGGRYYFDHSTSTFTPYGLAELGLHFIGITTKYSVKITSTYFNPYTGAKTSTTSNGGSGTLSDSEVEFGLGLGGGFLYDLGEIKLDFNAKINILSDPFNNFTLMAGVLFPLQ